MDIPMDIKKDFRRESIAARNRLSTEEVRLKSLLVFERLCSLGEYKNSAIIMAYMSFGNEVLTRPFIDRCFRDGKRVAVPRVMAPLGAARHLAAYEIKDPDKNMVPGYKGILEPDASVLERLEPGVIDMAIVPGVAFDRDCYRMGYGAGYYDRFLPLLRTGCLKAGVAFDLQLKEQVPTDEYDFRLDMVITESMVLDRANDISR